MSRKINQNHEWYSASGNHYTGSLKIDLESTKKTAKKAAKNMLNSAISDTVTATGTYKATYTVTKNKVKAIKTAASAVIVSHVYTAADNIVKLGTRIFGNSD